jgi:transcriptional regulator
VHCSGTIELQDEPALDASLENLVQRSESSYPQSWRTDEIPRSEITRRFAGIVGFRIHVNRIEAKFKLGQDEPLQDALAVADNLERQASPVDHAVAALIRKHNQDRTL